MNKIHLIPIALTGTSCFAEIQKGEFEIKLTDNDKKDNFKKTFETLKNGWDFIMNSPKEGYLKNNNSVYFTIEKDKIQLCDIDKNNGDKYDFYKYYIGNYVTLKERVHNIYNLMENKHEIKDIKTCKIKIDIPEDYINKYTNLQSNINFLKKELFNDEDYGFLIFNDAYRKYIEENYHSFNIELKNGEFVITANKKYVEKNDRLVEHQYYIKVFIDPTKAKDYVVNDKYKDFNLEKIQVYTYSIGDIKSADDLIEDFKKCGYVFNIEGYKLCDDKGKEIKGKLKAGTYCVKNDKFFTKNSILELYDKFLKDFNENSVNGVEELIYRESISEEDFRNKMTAINEFFEKFSNDKTKEYIKYKDLFEDSNYIEIINNKFEYLNELRRKLMAMYMYKNVIANVNGIISKLQKNDVSDLNIDDFFNDDSKPKNYSNNFIYGIYQNFKEDFIEEFSVNREFYYNDVTKQDYKPPYEKNCVEYEISNLIGPEEYDNYKDLQKKLEELLNKNKDNLFTNIYKIDADITNLNESNKATLAKLVNEINNNIKNKVLYKKTEHNLSYDSLFKTLRLKTVFYTNNSRVLFFDIFIDGEKVFFDYSKPMKELFNEVLPKGEHTVLLKFYDCVETYGDLSDWDNFSKMLIAQIAIKNYEETEINKINDITSLAELNKKYKKIIDTEYKGDFFNYINCLQESGITEIKYRHYSNREKEDYIHLYKLPNIYNTAVKKLQQLEKDEMAENERKGVEEIENKYKGLVDNLIKEINSTETLEKLKELPYSKREDIKKHLEDKVKSEVDDYDNKKSKISNFDIFVNNYVEQVYNAYNTKSSNIIKDEEEKKIKAAEEEEKKKKKDEEDKKKKNTGDNTVQTNTEDNTVQNSTEDNNKQQKNNRKPCCNCNKKPI